jgi:hypothetical protein
VKAAHLVENDHVKRSAFDNFIQFFGCGTAGKVKTYFAVRFYCVADNDWRELNDCMEALRRSDYPQAAIRDDFTCAESSTKGRQPLCTGVDPVFLKARQLIFERAGMQACIATESCCNTSCRAIVTRGYHGCRGRRGLGVCTPSFP